MDRCGGGNDGIVISLILSTPPSLHPHPLTSYHTQSTHPTNPPLTSLHLTPYPATLLTHPHTPYPPTLLFTPPSHTLSSTHLLHPTLSPSHPLSTHLLHPTLSPLIHPPITPHPFTPFPPTYYTPPLIPFHITLSPTPPSHTLSTHLSHHPFTLGQARWWRRTQWWSNRSSATMPWCAGGLMWDEAAWYDTLLPPVPFHPLLPTLPSYPLLIPTLSSPLIQSYHSFLIHS